MVNVSSVVDGMSEIRTEKRFIPSASLVTLSGAISVESLVKRPFGIY